MSIIKKTTYKDDFKEAIEAIQSVTDKMINDKFIKKCVKKLSNKKKAIKIDLNSTKKILNNKNTEGLYCFWIKLNKKKEKL